MRGFAPYCLQGSKSTHHTFMLHVLLQPVNCLGSNSSIYTPLLRWAVKGMTALQYYTCITCWMTCSVLYSKPLIAWRGGTKGACNSLFFHNFRSHREITADRRHKETEALQEIGRSLPLSKSQVERSNHSSLLRLAINFIKARELMATAGLDSGELTTRGDFGWGRFIAQ